MHHKPSHQASATHTHRMRRWHLVALSAVIAVLAAAGAVIAQTAGDPTPNGNAIDMVWATRGLNQTSTHSTAFLQVPGAVRTITVPQGPPALILARFTAESQCGGEAPGSCSVRIVFGNDAGLFSGADFAFDQVGTAGDDLNEAHAMDRWKVLGPGTHLVRVQYRVSDIDVGFALDDWSFIVERSR